MAYFETGHARNVANFEELVMIITNMGTDYNPVAKAIQSTTLEELKTQLQKNMQTLNDKNGIYRDKIYARQNVYEQMSKLAGRLVNTMIGLGLDSKILAQAKNILTKIRGTNGKRKSKTDNNTEMVAKTVSVSQMSFDQRKNNFNALLSLANTQVDYKPNEDDMQIKVLQDYITGLQNANSEANKAEQDLIIARQQRDNLLYAENVGIIQLVQQVKAYIKGKFGAKSNEFERIKGIRFSGTKL